MIISKLNKYLKKCDLHGDEISLTYNRQTSFQTSMGGILTIVSRLGILIYFLVIVGNIANRDSTITINVDGLSPTSDY